MKVALLLINLIALHINTAGASQSTVLADAAESSIRMIFNAGAASEASPNNHVFISMIQDDATAYLMSDENEPTALLSVLMSKMRARAEIKSQDYTISDTDLVHALLDQTRDLR